MVEIDSYYEAVIDSDRSLTSNYPDGTGSLAYGQTFKPTYSYKLTSCKFNIRRGSQALTGNLKAYLYEHTGDFASGKPIGDPLEISDSLDMSTLTTTYTLYTFTFTAGYTLVANTAYCLAIYSTDSNMSGSKPCRIGAINTGSHEGNGFRYLSTVGEWEAYSTIDVMFYVYGDGPLLDVDTEINQFPDNVIMSTTSSNIETWLDGLSITTLHKLNINHIGGFYKVVCIYE